MSLMILMLLLAVIATLLVTMSVCLSVCRSVCLTVGWSVPNKFYWSVMLLLVYVLSQPNPNLNHNPNPNTTKSWVRHGNHQKPPPTTTHHHHKLKLHERTRIEQDLENKSYCSINKMRKNSSAPTTNQKITRLCQKGSKWFP